MTAVLLAVTAVLAAVLVAASGLTRRQARGSQMTRVCTRCSGTGRVRLLTRPGQPARCPICSGRGRNPRQEGAWS